MVDKMEPGGRVFNPSDDSAYSDPVLRNISWILMEENTEERPSMFHDQLALQAMENSLSKVLGEQYPGSPYLPHIHVESPDGISYGSSSASDGTSPINFVDSQCDGYHLQSTLQPTSRISFNISNNMRNVNDGPMISCVNELVQKKFGDGESVLQFKKGLEEASKFVPSPNQLFIDWQSNNLSLQQVEASTEVVIAEKNVRGDSQDEMRARKNHEREDIDVDEWRNHKQTAVYTEESELSDMFDKVLLYPIVNNEPVCFDEAPVQNLASKMSETNGELIGSQGGKTLRGRKNKKKEEVSTKKKGEAADLRTLLILCAQAVSVNDSRTANEQLKQIRKHSSPSGDGSQRMAHYIANALEARLLGSLTGTHNFYAALASNKKHTAADLLRTYRTYLSAFPFKKVSISYANQMILKVAKNATTLHIVDFGILDGFQWPMLIQLLSTRSGRPPKLRITGIEVPQAGFRPAERIEETGRRLAKYCERFNVPFEYKPVAVHNWETIKVEELEINSNEVLAVNWLFRSSDLLDETVEINCPRDAVMNLIRKMNPHIFVHAIFNGSYNSPYFVSRFREALFHFSALFDMFDTCLPHDNQQRLTFEREFYGREAAIVIACEGRERPETYKQWQVRSMRAGFKPLPLDKKLMKQFRAKLKELYHKDFLLDENSQWLLQGWKGRVIYACSCWVPA
ncbi:scarecrow-like protein 34 [Tripterygium wilfordii]|uniref:Scarecrow-like protein 34 n=1 Tax=Tripterygium wilfordii TaxID=458696 RepID=A0A7J7C0C3_TRIWF|nr:scarecrow-like protein 34 [Tripterygium wilfordii]KAF5727375.1 scarecrow-like protein 34 [Tripterygium wilfordii]